MKIVAFENGDKHMVTHPNETNLFNCVGGNAFKKSHFPHK